ncbi:hypothetical protein B484DRAFT_290496 [Ochromonadaceae sp. CCMP2298]|nr:hypothetical protein B484DRAFT_290496 [Ochromonadaceae sp. CCMP2298]
MCEEGWESMQNQQYQYSVRGVDYQEHRPRFVQDWTEVGSGAGTDAGAGGALLLRIFRHFMTPSLVASVVGALFEADRRWNYLGKGTKKADSSLRGIYKTLAVKIRIYGMQGQGQGQGQGRAKRVRGQGQEGGQGEQGGKGQEQGGQEKGQGKKRSLDRAVEQARVHFEGLRMGALQDRARISKLLARFLLTQSHAAQLSANFQSGLSEVGDYLGGGEKLLSSFQDASDSSSSSSSNSSGSSSSSGAFSDKGVWFQQLVVKLSSGRSYLLHYLLQRREGGEEGRMAEVVEQWGGLVRAKGRAESILAFDGYFADHALRTHLLQQPFAFCASVRQQQFEDVFGMLRDMDGVGGVGRVDRGAGAVGGDRCMHRLQSHETLSYFGDAARGLGKKLCIGNCVRRVRATAVPGAGSSSGAGTSTGADTGAGLLSDTYREAFSQVDAFNAQLHGRKWPHKHGGNGVAGEEGHVDDFAFSALLQNVFNAYEDVCGAGAGLGAGGAGAGAGAGEYAFRPHCLALADALFIHAADGVESDDDV